MEEIAELKFNLRETCEECRCFSDDELYALIDKNKGDVRAASYEGLLIKAENDGIVLPSGVSVENNRNYWLSLARHYRPNCNACIERADEVI